MGHILKSLMKGVSALMLIAGLTLSYMPATAAEKDALGPDPTRISLVQMRMAKVALAVAPERSVQIMAEALDVPELFVREAMLALAEGRDLQPEPQQAAVTPPPVPGPAPSTGRRIDAGGALFVKAPE